MPYLARRRPTGPEGKSTGGLGDTFFPVTDTQGENASPAARCGGVWVHEPSCFLEGIQPGNSRAEGSGELGLPDLEPLNLPPGYHLPQVS